MHTHTQEGETNMLEYVLVRICKCVRACFAGMPTNNGKVKKLEKITTKKQQRQTLQQYRFTQV